MTEQKESVEEATSRVTQNWPVSLKDKVVDLVGKRKLTEFTLEAVRDKLARDTGQLGPVSLPRLPQRPAEPAPVVEQAAQPAPEPVAAPVAAEDDPENHRPMYMTGRDKPPAEPAPEPTPEPAFDADLDGPSGLSVDDDDQAAEAEVQAGPPALPPSPAPGPPSTTASKEDLFARIREQGVEMGVDLRPASEVLSPTSAPQAAPVREREPTVLPPPVLGAPPAAVQQPVEEMPPTTPVVPPVQPSPVDASAFCTNCGGELIDGECWECM